MANEMGFETENYNKVWKALSAGQAVEAKIESKPTGAYFLITPAFKEIINSAQVSELKQLGVPFFSWQQPAAPAPADTEVEVIDLLKGVYTKDFLESIGGKYWEQAPKRAGQPAKRRVYFNFTPDDIGLEFTMKNGRVSWAECTDLESGEKSVCSNTRASKILGELNVSQIYYDLDSSEFFIKGLDYAYLRVKGALEYYIKCAKKVTSPESSAELTATEKIKAQAQSLGLSVQEFVEKACEAYCD